MTRRVLCRHCLRPIMPVTIRRRHDTVTLRLEPEPSADGTHVPHPDGWTWTHRASTGIGPARDLPAHRVHVCRDREEAA